MHLTNNNHPRPTRLDTTMHPVCNQAIVVKVRGWYTDGAEPNSTDNIATPPMPVVGLLRVPLCKYMGEQEHHTHANSEEVVPWSV